LNPLYPFGYGLSYTTFEYKSVSMTQLNDRITVSVTLGNTGSCDGEEVVQIYARKRFTSVKQPERELKAYKRVAVAKGEQVTVSFDLLFDSLCYHNIDNQLCLENCTLDVMLGASSEDIRAEQTFSLVFENGMRKVHRRAFTNPAKEDRRHTRTK
jgi:beta-glucosidase